MVISDGECRVAFKYDEVHNEVHNEAVNINNGYLS